MIVSKFHVLICAGTKLVGDKKGLCHTRGGVELVRKLIEELEEKDLSQDVIVSATSCYGICDKGPIMVVYPQGVWYGQLDEDKIETIVEEHLEGGQIVTQLMLK
ncbi:MAG: (2Fe-2S) ferredoxin domain-containing protein [Deltaproteobacteria bacterium]|jgi:(2Fe-2S) ferredoxin|nr:(2Fe-2S) ferredoxin domain-containing protein [Deltaproteobacteria bacterium]